MLQISISLRALVFVLLLAAMALTGSDVARGAPASANVDVNGIVFTNPGVNGVRDIRTEGNQGGLRIYNEDPILSPNPKGAALQFFANDSNFPGMAFLDAGKHNSGAIIFRTATTSPNTAITERMRVAANGNVGIGTFPNNPSQKLDVDFGDILVQGPNSFFGIGTQATLSLGDTNHYIRSINNAGVRIGSFQVPDAIALAQTTGNVGIGTTTPQARLHVEGNTIINGSAGIGTTTPLATLHAATSGNATYNILGQHTGSGIGVAGSSNTGTGVYGESTSGFAGHFAGNVKITGEIRNSGDVCILNCPPSDARLKRDIQPLNPVLASLTALQPVEFSWRTEEFPERRFPSERATGLVAQDVEPVMPELLTDDGWGFKGVRYERLPVLLLQGLKELAAQNAALEAQVQVLQQAGGRRDLVYRAEDSVTAGTDQSERIAALEQQNMALVQQNANLDARLSASEQQNAALEARLSALEHAGAGPDRLSALPANAGWPLLALVVAGIAVAARRRLTCR